MRVTRPVQTAVIGARDAPAVERSGFGLLTSYGVTLGIARAVSYIKERRRPAPRLLGLGRRAADAISRDDLRVHHYVPGMAVAFASGVAAILRLRDGLGFGLSLAFGTGAGLTLDEIMVLVERKSAYWHDKNVAALQCGAAAVAATALGVRFHRRGRRLLQSSAVDNAHDER